MFIVALYEKKWFMMIMAGYQYQLTAIKVYVILFKYVKLKVLKKGW